MPRLARIVVAGHPHHVVQRGVRRRKVFLCEDDYAAFARDLAESSREHGLSIWAWCLMPSHFHLLAVPEREGSLVKPLARATWLHARRVNFRERCRGRLWQGRFHSCVLDGDHALACARYVEMNPVGAKLVERARDWRWSSARFHLRGKPDGLTVRGPLEDEIPDWKTFLGDAEVDTGAMRRHTSS